MREAAYARGSETADLVFAYTVQACEIDMRDKGALVVRVLLTFMVSCSSKPGSGRRRYARV